MVQRPRVTLQADGRSHSLLWKEGPKLHVSLSRPMPAYRSWFVLLQTICI